MHSTYSWVLGTHALWHGKSEEIFTKGDWCEAIRDQRWAKITYRPGTSTKIVSATEPTVCYYEFEIQIACGDKILQSQLSPEEPAPISQDKDNISDDTSSTDETSHERVPIMIDDSTNSRS